MRTHLVVVLACATPCASRRQQAVRRCYLSWKNLDLVERSLCCVDVSCSLRDGEVRSLLNEVTRTWRVADAVLKEHDLQDIIDCTIEGDTISLQTTQRIQPRKRLEISQNLTIDGAWSQRNNVPRASMTCPSKSEGLFLIK